MFGKTLKYIFILFEIHTCSHYLDQTYQNIEYSNKSLITELSSSPLYKTDLECKIPSTTTQDSDSKTTLASLNLGQTLTKNLAYIQAESHGYSFELSFVVTSFLLSNGEFQISLGSTLFNFLNVGIKREEGKIKIVAKNDKFSCHQGSLDLDPDSLSEDSKNVFYCQSGEFITGQFEISLSQYSESVIETCSYENSVIFFKEKFLWKNFF